MPNHVDHDDKARGWDFFIAYPHDRSAEAHRLYELLSPRHRVFLDKQCIRPGDDWDVVLAHAQRTSRCTLVLISSDIEPNHYLRDEIATAVDLSRGAPDSHRVVPIFLERTEDDATVPYGLRLKSALDVNRHGGLKGVADRLMKLTLPEQPAGDTPPSRPKMGANQRYNVFRSLCSLRRADFEEVILRLNVPLQYLSELDASQATRGIDVVHWIGSAGIDLRSVQQAIDEVRDPSRHAGDGTSKLSRFFAWLLSWGWPSLHYRLVSQGRFPSPPEFKAVQDYLGDFVRDMKSLNRGEPVTYVDVDAGEVATSAAGATEYAVTVSKGQVIKRVRQVLRLLSGLAQGGDRTTAQLASVSRRSRVVRNVVRVLLRSRTPVILLGDPGSGKSMTLREAGLHIAEQESRRVLPRVVVYLRLGQYRAASGGEPGEVYELIRKAIPPKHKALAIYLPKLMAEDKGELFEVYVHTLHNRLEQQQGIRHNEQERRELERGWAKIAFLMTRHYCGTYISLALLEGHFDSDVMDDVIESGKGCGLLMVDPSDESLLRFSHHRLQEYSAARHLADEKPEIDWLPLLDTPRWQETLLMLVSVDPQSHAVETLSRSLAPPTVLDSDEERWALPLEKEQHLADRVILMSHMTREASQQQTEVPAELAERYAASLQFLADYGRPTTQVKMLWAWKNTPEVCALETRSTPLRSEIGWVRDQAVEVVAGMAGSRTRIGADVHREIAFDFASGQIINRLPVYCRSIQGVPLLHWLPTLLWAVFSQLLYFAGILFGCWLAIHFACSIWSIPYVSPPVVELLCGFALVLGIPLYKREAPHDPLQALAFAATVVALLCLCISKTYSQGLSWILFFFSGLFGTIGFLTPAFVQVVFWFSWLVFIPATYLRTSRSGISEDLFRIAASRSKFLEYREFLSQYLFLTSANLFYLVGILLRDLKYVSPLWPIFLAGWVFFVSGIAVSARRWAAEIGWSVKLYVCCFAVILPAAIVVPLAIVEDMNWAISLARHGALFLLVALVTALLATASAFYLLRWLRIRFIRRAVLNSSIDEWVNSVRRGSQYLQYYWLKFATAQVFGITSQAFLGALIQVEPYIHSRHSTEIYWEMRHELEQAIRQERLEGWSDESDVV